jgi:hypothetical protein
MTPTPTPPPPTPAAPSDKAWRPLFQWLLFTVAMAAAPLGVRYSITGVFSNTWDWMSQISRGELYVVAMAFCGEVLGEVAFSEKREIRHMLLGFAAAMLLLFSGCFFISMDNVYLFGGAPPQAQLIAKSSFLLSAISWFCGMAVRWPGK